MMIISFNGDIRLEEGKDLWYILEKLMEKKLGLLIKKKKKMDRKAPL